MAPSDISAGQFRDTEPLVNLPRKLPLGIGGTLARIAAWGSNRAERRGLSFAPEAAGLPIVDLHADTLLWGFDPWRGGPGHIDIPRLAASGVSLQVFAAPTWTPLPSRDPENAICVDCESMDQSLPLFPSEFWSGLKTARLRKKRRRAFRIARRFHAMVEKGAAHKKAQLMEIDGPEALDSLTKRRGRTGPPAVGVLLSLEGVHWISADAEPEAVRAEVATLKAAGFRMIALTHRFSNGLGGASEDCNARGGLTPAGRTMVETCLNEGVALDLAHASRAVVDEAAEIALDHPNGRRPVFVSHAGVAAVHDQPRNLTAREIQAVAETGGVIGVGFWRSAMGWADSDPWESKVDRIVESCIAVLDTLEEPDFVRRMFKRYGHYNPYEHIGFGSDFDGAVVTPFDVSGVSHVVAALARAERGGRPVFPRDKLALISGGNAMRVLKKALTPQPLDI